ncbi:MAG: hypothetical protein ABIH38_00300 [Patescibacteria group bacterium]
MKKILYAILFGTFALGLLSGVGCAPAKKEMIEEIESNQTAFLVPMEGDTAQAKFMSLEYLEHAKVAVKRVSHAQRKIVTGRGRWNRKWVATTRLIMVDRTPVTREWTGEKDRGTANKDQAIYVESKESIGFGVGVNVTAFVKEEDAATFLYWYAGKPLADVVDENVRGYVTSILSSGFGSLDLVDARGEKAAIFKKVFEMTQVHFKEKGITIDNLGYAEGLIYEDKEIQDGINDRFLAELSRQTAAQEKMAQDERNAMKVAMAIAERKSSQEFAIAKEAAIKIRELEISLLRAQAQKIAAEKWNGGLPANIMPEGMGFLMNLNANPSGK